MILIAAYFIISLYLGKRNPYYYLILPFALIQGPGAFINQRITLGGKLFFSCSAAVFNETIFVVLLIILLINKSKEKHYIKSNLSKFVLGYLIFILFLTLYSFIVSKNNEDVLLTVRPFIYTPICYFIWMKILSTGTKVQFYEFIKYLLLVTVVSDVLYIINSSKIFQIFESTEMYMSIEEGGSSFFRDFKSLPLFGMAAFMFSIIHLLRKLKFIPKWILIANLILFPFVILFTFTRSYLIMGCIQVLIIFILNLSRITQFFSSFRRIAIILISILTVYYVGKTVFSAPFNYFSERIKDALYEKKDEANVSIRVEYFNTAINLLEKENKLLFGQGFVRDSYPKLFEIGAFGADSTVPLLIIHTGWIGVLFVYLIWTTGFYFALKTYFKTKDWIVQFISANAISTIISSFIMGTDLKGGVMALFYFSLLTVVKYNLWQKSPSRNLVNINYNINSN